MSEPRPMAVSRIRGAADFAAARAAAQDIAGDAALLLAWQDRAAGRAAPEVPECTRKPGWIAYAEGHGADLRVEVNDGAYVFYFLRGEDTGAG